MRGRRVSGSWTEGRLAADLATRETQGADRPQAGTPGDTAGDPAWARVLARARARVLDRGAWPGGCIPSSASFAAGLPPAALPLPCIPGTAGLLPVGISRASGRGMLSAAAEDCSGRRSSDVFHVPQCDPCVFFRLNSRTGASGLDFRHRRDQPLILPPPNPPPLPPSPGQMCRLLYQ